MYLSWVPENITEIRRLVLWDFVSIIYLALHADQREQFLQCHLLKPNGHMMHQQFNIQQLYVLPTLYLCVLYLSEIKQRLMPLTAQTDWFL